MTSVVENKSTERPPIHLWDSKSNIKKIYDYNPGDLVAFTDLEKYGAISVGEVVNIGQDEIGIYLQVHRLEREMLGSKIWHFNEENTQCIVRPLLVKRHVSHDPSLGALTKERVRKAWRMIGFVVGCEKYCLIQHENEVELDIAPGDSDDEDEDEIDEEMKDFIVPDDEGEAFCHPKAEHLTEEEKAWVNQTHSAVRDWDKWVPKDQSEKAIKAFVDNMTAKYGVQEDNRQFTSGTDSVDIFKPPSL